MSLNDNTTFLTKEEAGGKYYPVEKTPTIQWQDVSAEKIKELEISLADVVRKGIERAREGNGVVVEVKEQEFALKGLSEFLKGGGKSGVQNFEVAIPHTDNNESIYQKVNDTNEFQQEGYKPN